MTALNEIAWPGQASPGQLAPDAAAAIGFLERWMVGSEPRSLLVSIVPDSPTIHGHTFDLPGDNAMAQWIERCNRIAGVYWTVNLCKPDLTKKARKADVEWLLGIWADLDPIKGCELPVERARLLRLTGELMALRWPPTVIIDSGGGIQPLWRLETPLEASEECRQANEALGRRIEAALGGIENTSNVDRLLRLPGTINLPDAKKLEKGRGPVLSGIISATWRRHSWRDLEALADHLEQQPLASARIYKPKPNGKGNTQASGSAPQALDLPEVPPEPFDEERIAFLIENNPDLIGPWETTQYPSQSERDAALASWARKQGWPIYDAWALIITNRETFGDRNDQKKTLRRDYVLRTLRFAYANNGATTAPSNPNPESNEWPEPGRIGAGIPDAPAFPIDVLPPVLRDWALDQSDRMQAPVDFLAIPALITLCGCIGKAATLRPKRRDDWAERPCLWAVLIADPGSMKSVTLKAATDPLRAVEKKKMADWQSVHVHVEGTTG